MLSSVVYHESLHQDYPEHDRGFNAKAKLFPQYDDLFCKLQNHGELVHSEIQYSENYNRFIVGKKNAVYILLPFSDKYSEVASSRDGMLLLDFDVPLIVSLISVSDSTLFVFLAESAGKYWIVGWCTKAKLLTERKTESFAKYGDYDISYQMVCDFNEFYLLPVSTCTYSIEMSDMSLSFKENHCCQYGIDEASISSDIKYIESYCEGYLSIGFDPKNISIIPEYNDLTVAQMKKIKVSNYGAVWNANAIVKKEPTTENFYLRAKAKQNAWLNKSALEDYMCVLNSQPDNILCVSEIIKLCAILSQFEEGKAYIKQYKERLPHDDSCLKAAIKFLDKEIV